MESKYGGSLYEFSEVITPAGKLEEHEYTPKQPQIILFLIQ